MAQNNNPLLCDPATGICEIATTNQSASKLQNNTLEKPVKIIYFTDPICSSCWGIEPQLRKLKLEYGTEIEIEYRMGGLLPDWSYNSGGISKPSDLAHHWNEVSLYYDMPIDGDVWLENPLHSSYPPSIAFKAAQIQNKEKAIHFLRKIREMVFLEKKNICNWEHLAQAASECGLDVQQMKIDYENKAIEDFKQDLALGRQMGVRGFPTLFFLDDSQNQQILYGFKPYAAFEEMIIKVFPKALKKNYETSWNSLFNKYPSLTAKEFSELSNLSRKEGEQILNDLSQKGTLIKCQTKNGALWKLK
ncbi:ClpXP adapter SpxH family protein [Flavobacterium flavipallidum]|uniref:ClpXP adapter SpxH family protein n=1 Tax=Flavobacterium flavipallidum TaxID=3139140 RepID=A0ABU9HME3_9FLAO